MDLPLVNAVQQTMSQWHNKQLLQQLKQQLLRNALQDTKYLYYNNKYMYVQPYYKSYAFFAKKHQFNRTISDVLTNDYRIHTVQQNHSITAQQHKQQHVENLLQNGYIKINQHTIHDPTTMVQSNDYIENTYLHHKHEPIVLDVQSTVLYENKHLLVVNKPPSIMIHPHGSYNRNTLTHQLMLNSDALHQFSPINRLDRVTSGIVLLSKRKEYTKISRVTQQDYTNNISEAIQTHTKVLKTYIARVRGKFPAHDIHCTQPIVESRFIKQTHRSYVHSSGKDSETLFRRISTDGDTSVVECIARTGRTHQIRVHLAWLGYPIANDFLYSNYLTHSDGSLSTESADDAILVNAEQSIASLKDAYKLGRRSTATMNEQQIYQQLQHLQCIDENCHICMNELLDSDKQSKYQVLWLHAYKWRYDEQELNFEAELPPWAIL